MHKDFVQFVVEDCRKSVHAALQSAHKVHTHSTDWTFECTFNALIDSEQAAHTAGNVFPAVRWCIISHCRIQLHNSTTYSSIRIRLQNYTEESYHQILYAEFYYRILMQNSTKESYCRICSAQIAQIDGEQAASGAMVTFPLPCNATSPALHLHNSHNSKNIITTLQCCITHAVHLQCSQNSKNWLASSLTS